MKYPNLIRDFDKTLKVVESCVTYSQLNTARQMTYLWRDMYRSAPNYEDYSDHLRIRLQSKEIEQIQNLNLELKANANDK